MDTSPKVPFQLYAASRESGGTSLYYAALCGLQDIVEYLVAQHVNTSGGQHMTPLVAALAGRHFQTGRHLLHNGARVDRWMCAMDMGTTPSCGLVWRSRDGPVFTQL
jgi:hypothetical protein